MGLSSSLNAGVMGLAVNAVKLGTISDNIANSKTFGYKRSDVEFQDMVLSQTAGSFSAGGVNAIAFRDAGAQGVLTTTANSMDIAVSGRGMLPVTGIGGLNAAPADRELLLTSTGSFSPDEDGFLRTLGGNFLLGWAADSNGNVGSQPRDSVAGLEPVRINLNQFAASPTTIIRLGVNLPATETEAGGAGATLTLPTEYFDTLGRSQTLTTEFTPVVPAIGASNEWNVDIFDGASLTPLVPIGSFNVVFDSSATAGGSVATVTPSGSATFDPVTGFVQVATFSGTLDLEVAGATLGASPLTQLASSFAPLNVSKDGAPIGNLSTLEIDETGFIQAVFDTGFRRTIFQIPLANVPNFKGVVAAGNASFRVTQDSGDFFLWDAGDGPVGLTSGFALAESTTDIAQELTDLIETQRAYSSNAKIIQTVDEMLQETTDIIR